MNEHVIVWRYDVRPAMRDEFERAYGPDGVWADFFGNSGGYPGTRLLRDVAIPDRYVTLDLWRTKGDFASFIAEHRADYGALDRRCEPLTTAELRLGTFRSTDVTG